MARLRPAQPPPEEGSPSSGSWVRWLLPYGSRFAQRMPAFASRDFRIFWIGQLISLTGTWIQSVAQQWLVLRLTHSAFDLGLVTTVQFIPLLLLSLVGGAFADQLPKRNLLLLTQVAAGILALILGVLVQTGSVQYWHVLLLAFGLGTINAFYTPTRQAFVPELVPKEALLNAVALNSALFNGARVVGPAVGGILIAAVGLTLNFYLNAASYLAVIAGLLLIAPRPVVKTSARRGLVSNVGEGLSYIRETPVVYTILALVGVASLFAYNFTILLPLVAQYVLHGGSTVYGFLTAAMGTGSLAGAIILATFNRRDLARRFIYGGMVIFTAGEILLGFSRLYALDLGLLVIIGLASVFFTTTANTRVLSLTPSHLQGRVMSVYSLMFLGVTPFGSFLAGLVAQRFGAPDAMIAGASITLAFGVAVFLYRPTERARRRAETA